MKAIPAPLLVERNKKEVGPLQRLQDRLAGRFPGQRLTDLGIHPGEHGRLEQETLLHLRQWLKDLLLHIIQDKAMTAGKRLDKG